MNLDRWIGSAGTRVATLTFALLCLTVVAVHMRRLLPQTGQLAIVVACASGLLALVGVIYSFHPVYSLWMRMAKGLNTIVVTVLFGACYLIIVPVFFLVVFRSDPLRLRRRFDPKTFWIPRHRDPIDSTAFRRMG